MDFDEYNKHQKKEKEQNYKSAMATFSEAQELATLNGFELIQHSPWHFALIREGKAKCIYNLYPSNQRIYADPKYESSFLKVPKPWTFLDIVSAAIIQSQLDPIKKAIKKVMVS